MYLVYIAIGLAAAALAICIYILINNRRQYGWLQSFLNNRVILRLPPPGRDRTLEPPQPQPQPSTESDDAVDQVSLVSASLTPETLNEFNLE